MRRILAIVLCPLSLSAGSGTAYAQSRDADALIAAEQEAMLPLAFLDGEWRGEGWTLSSSGERISITQTERIGPFLEGSVKVIEGRGYGADASLQFNAFGTISYDPDRQSYTLHSYAEGRVGDFTLMLTVDGFEYTIAQGSASIVYRLVVKDGSWREIGDRIVAGEPPNRVFETNLRRIAGTNWPAAGAVCLERR